jgi:hypothetical protein
MSTRPIVTEIDGVQYKSIGAAAKQIGMNYYTLQRRLRRGLPLTAGKLPSSLCRVVVVGGVSYPTVTAAARAVNVKSRSSLLRRLLAGAPVDAPMPTRKACSVVLDGVTYASSVVAAKVSRQTVWNRVERARRTVAVAT